VVSRVLLHNNYNNNKNNQQQQHKHQHEQQLLVAYQASDLGSSRVQPKVIFQGVATTLVVVVVDGVVVDGVVVGVVVVGVVID
jgi:hypothetical protein